MKTFEHEVSWTMSARAVIEAKDRESADVVLWFIKLHINELLKKTATKDLKGEYVDYSFVVNDVQVAENDRPDKIIN